MPYYSFNYSPIKGSSCFQPFAFIRLEQNPHIGICFHFYRADTQTKDYYCQRAYVFRYFKLFYETIAAIHILNNWRVFLLLIFAGLDSKNKNIG